MAHEEPSEISLDGWPDEQREALRFLLEEWAIRATWDGDRVTVAEEDAQHALALAAYLHGPSVPDLPTPSDVVAEDAPPSTIRELFSSVVPAFREPDPGPFDEYEHAIFVAVKTLAIPGVDPEQVFTRLSGWPDSAFTIPAEPNSPEVDLTVRVVEREAPFRCVLQWNDAKGEQWREVWVFEASEPDTIARLIVAVDRAAPDARATHAGFFSQYATNVFAAQRLGALRDMVRHERGGASCE